MEHFIKDLQIGNFKSIKSLKLDCKRINLFVGKPNVGKSNILEAISLLGISNFEQNIENLSEAIRFDIINNLFFDQNIKEPFLVKSNIKSLVGIMDRNTGNFELNSFDSKNNEIDFSIPISQYGSFSINKSRYSTVKKYAFKLNKVVNKHTTNGLFLDTPFGGNLFEILQTSKSLRKTVAAYFKDYKLEFLLDLHQRKFEIQKIVDGISYKTPYSLVADTLQRMIFHVAAIESNLESTLLFEEPENHSFPPYIRDLAERIVESETNQFFITTHSPYLLNTILEKGKDEVAIFVTSFSDHETKAKRLSKDEVGRLLDYGIDIFFNLNQFIDD